MPDFQDQRQDIDSIHAEVMPALDFLMKRIEQVEELVDKIVGGFTTAVDTHKRSALLTELQSKYGDKIGQYGGMYKDMYDRDLTDDFATTASDYDGEDGLDGLAGKIFGELDGKFGKYIPKPFEQAPEETKEPDVKPVASVEVTKVSGGKMDDKTKKEIEARARAMGARK